MAMVKISMWLAQSVHSKLKQLARKTSLPFSEHVRRAVDEYLKGK